MAFRYLVYRTDFGNTIIRETPNSSSTGGTEAELFTDFIIPEIQPLYLWRVTGGTDVVPNTDQNIADWLNFIDPPSGDDSVTYAIFSAYTATTQTELNDKVSFSIFNAFTAQTQTDLDGKIDKVTGATGNVGEFDASGNLIDTGLSVADITGLTGNDRYVSGMTYVGSTLTLQRTEGLPDLTVTIVSTGNTDGVVSGGTLVGTDLVLNRTDGLPDVTIDLSEIFDDIAFVSGATDQNTTDIQIVSGVTVTNAADIQFLSGVTSGATDSIVAISAATVQNAGDIQIVSGATVDNAADIAFISGETAANDADIAFISGVTDTKQDALNAGEGINSAALAADTIQVDLSAFTAIGGLDITLTGSTNAVINDLRTVALGLEYGGDYNANFTVRSLVDKGYVDAVAAGLDLKESVVVATTTGETDIVLVGGFSGVIDGVTLADGDRVLIKNQNSAKEENGIYVWSAGSSGFTRAIDFEDPNVTSGAFTFVETGNTNGGSGWVLVTQDPITIGTTELDFTQFSSTGSLTAGNGIDITNGTISVEGDDLNGDFLQWTGSQFNVTGLTTLVQFNAYTGATDTRISNIETDLTTVSGQTDNKLNTSDFDTYSGLTQTEIDGKIDKVIGATGNVGVFVANGNLEDSGSTIDDITAQKGPLKSVQVRQSTAVNSISQSWTDFNWDSTDIENDNTVIEHDTINTDRIFVFEDGLYFVTYQFEIDDEGSGRVRINDTTVIDGSLATGDASAVWIPVVKSFLVNLTAGDFITLQTIGLAINQDINAGANMIVVKWDGLKGDKGDSSSGGTGSIIFQENNVPVAGAPHDTLNFDNNFTVTDEGSGKVTVSLGAGMGADGLCELIDTTGGQEINNVTPVAMTWDTNEFIDTNFFTHTVNSSVITVLQTGLYEISYNINSANQTNSRSTTGVQVRKNGTLIGKTLTADYSRNTSNNDNTNALPATTVSMTANDTFDLVLFRLGDNNSTLTKANASFFRVKYLGS